ncbi:hypothetical protein C8F04DRAFT_1207920 [Mycena alexandri]|uniref:UBC core domain-containing protein n=1 Tax=Mycena alexandri TaxID=1745969 RepID=A0AAD6XEK4_9AGAR|nr:hypothetical protein C8F04DRAFT_1207920 [Mycena alexandri]
MARRAPTKFYQQDIVRRVQTPDAATSDREQRCWHDAEEVAPQTPFSDPLMRPLRQDEVGVSFYRNEPDSNTRREFDRQILPESDLILVDRTFHPGDFCKRTIEDVRSGVVLKARVNGRCYTALEELSDRTYAEVGDYVTYDDWIGQLYDEVLVEISSGEIVRLPELGSRLSVGEKGPDIIPPPASTVHNLFGFLLGNNRPSPNDTCVKVAHSVYAVTWLAVSQALDPEEAEKRRRPQKFWMGADTSKLILIRSLADLEMRVGDRVTFKDEDEVPGTTHGPSPVTETLTWLEVLWQDGTKETVRSTELIPYLNPDEYDCWPGDYVIWNREDEKRAVIIQSVDAAQRTASSLTLTGTSDTFAMLEAPSDGLGVRRGDFLFVHPEGKTNGSPVVARVPRIGEVEAWVRDAPFADGQLSGFRKEMEQLGRDIAHRRASENIVEGPILRPSLAVRSYPLQRLTKLYDGIDQLEDDMWDEMSEGHVHAEENLPWTINEEGGAWEPDDAESTHDWPSYSDEEGESDGHTWPEDVPLSPLLDVVNGLLSSDILYPLGSDTPPAEVGTPLDDAADADDTPPDDLDSEDESESPWKRFEVLASAPEDPRLLQLAPCPTLEIVPRSFNARVPHSILVRAYEDRTDLLRSMIIGPENTPYEDAPFVIDWMLDSNFPHSPPIAHFLSWTNGNGREGKVCLSILGTWAGDKNEIWNSARSSLLQAFVSIQGLVLVKEPSVILPQNYRSAGIDSELSRLYNEKAYVLSRGFVRRALELPPGGLEPELDWLYHRTGRLDKVITDAQQLIEKSKAAAAAAAETVASSEEDRELAVPRLSAGGIITLDRTLVKLISLRSRS